MTLQEMSEVLNIYFKPKTSSICERRKFYVAMQREDESVNGFIARIKGLAKGCKFGAFLHDALRDKLICGLKYGLKDIQERLLLEGDNLSWEKTVEISTGIESVHQDSFVGDTRSEGGEHGDIDEPGKAWAIQMPPMWEIGSQTQ